MSRQSREVVKELKDRFLEGEKLSVKDIIEEYYNPGSPYAYLVAVKTARQMIRGIKNSFRKIHGIWFGCLDTDGNYGVATTVDEVRYAVLNYYKFVKGNLLNANILVGNARQNGILPPGLVNERLLIARVKEDDDK